MKRSKSNTKARMLETTISLIELQGYHATGLNQIVQESSTPKGSLYFHFPSGKEQLAAEAILLAGKQVKQKVEQALKSSDDLGTAIKSFVLAIACELETSDFRKGCPVATVAMEASATHDTLRQACEAVYSSWFELVSQRFITSGFDPVETESWTLFIWSAVEGSLLLSRNRRSTKPLETVANQLEILLSQLTLHSDSDANSDANAADL
ncbi:MAG: TetR/AcrR family transcriptional regulator [Elainellaceae cyanobacterium]